MSTIKRIPGVGYLIGASLTLTQRATREAGYLLADGNDGGEPARRMRDRIHTYAQEQATAIGKRVEVYATRRGSQGWLANVADPRLSARAEAST